MGLHLSLSTFSSFSSFSLLLFYLTMIRIILTLLLFIYIVKGELPQHEMEKEEYLSDRIKFHCKLSCGDFDAELYPQWSPLGVHRYKTLIEEGFFDGAPLFRAVKNFLVQYGIPADPERERPGRILDDPSYGIPFRKGTLCKRKKKEIIIIKKNN